MTRWIRVVSALLVVCFLSSELSYAAPELSAPLASPLKPMEALCQDPSSFNAPTSFCSLKDVHPGSNGKLILHIQDAHSNLSGQQNLASVLDEVMTRYNVSLVLSEGGAGDCSLTPIRKVASPDVLKQVAKKYLREGKIAGEEYLNLTSSHPMKIIGIENMDLYTDSVQNYAKLAKQRQEILDYLSLIQHATKKLKNVFYPQEILEYEKTLGENGESKDGSLQSLLGLAERREGLLSSFPSLGKLKILQAQEKQIDFNAANLEQATLFEALEQKGVGKDIQDELLKLRQSKNSQVSQFSLMKKLFQISNEKNIPLSDYPQLTLYEKYLEAFSQIDMDSVLDESQRLEDEVYRLVLNETDSPEKALTLRTIDRYLGLLQTAYRIQMTTHDFETLTVNESDFATSAYLAFVNTELMLLGYFDDVIAYKDVMEKGREALKAFYDSVAKRDVAFVENAKKAMDTPSAGGGQNTVAVLITGGYHTPHLKKLFADKGYSFITLTPIVTTPTNQKKYEELLLNPILPKVKKLEVISSGEKKNKSLSDISDLAPLRPKKNEGVRAFLLEQAMTFAIQKSGSLENALKSADTKIDLYFFLKELITTQMRLDGKNIDEEIVKTLATSVMIELSGKNTLSITPVNAAVASLPTLLGDTRAPSPTATVSNGARFAEFPTPSKLGDKDREALLEGIKDVRSSEGRATLQMSSLAQAFRGIEDQVWAKKLANYLMDALADAYAINYDPESTPSEVASFDELKQQANIANRTIQPRLFNDVLDTFLSNLSVSVSVTGANLATGKSFEISTLSDIDKKRLQEGRQTLAGINKQLDKMAPWLRRYKNFLKLPLVGRWVLRRYEALDDRDHVLSLRARVLKEMLAPLEALEKLEEGVDEVERIATNLVRIANISGLGLKIRQIIATNLPHTDYADGGLGLKDIGWPSSTFGGFPDTVKLNAINRIMLQILSEAKDQASDEASLRVSVQELMEAAQNASGVGTYYDDLYRTDPQAPSTGYFRHYIENAPMSEKSPQVSAGARMAVKANTEKEKLFVDGLNALVIKNQTPEGIVTDDLSNLSSHLDDVLSERDAEDPQLYAMKAKNLLSVRDGFSVDKIIAQLEIARMFTIYDMTDPAGRRKEILFHNENHFNELLNFSIAARSLNQSKFNNADRIYLLLYLAIYFHDLGYFHSDKSTYAPDHEERSKLKVDEFAYYLGLTPEEVSVVKYLIDKTKFKLAIPNRRVNGDFGYEVLADDTVYRDIRSSRSASAPLSKETSDYLNEHFLGTHGSDLDLVQDAIIAGKIIALADTFGQDKINSHSVTFLQPEFSHDDNQASLRETLLARPTRLEQVADSVGFSGFVFSARLNLLLYGVDADGNALTPDTADKDLSISIDPALEQLRKEGIATKKSIGQWIAQLVTGDPQSDIFRSAEEGLKNFVDEGVRIGILSNEDDMELKQEIEGFKTRRADHRALIEESIKTRFQVSLEGEVLDALVKVCEVYQFKSGKVLFREGSSVSGNPFVYLIASGTVKVAGSGIDREMPGVSKGFIGEMAIARKVFDPMKVGITPSDIEGLISKGVIQREIIAGKNYLLWKSQFTAASLREELTSIQSPLTDKLVSVFEESSQPPRNATVTVDGGEATMIRIPAGAFLEAIKSSTFASVVTDSVRNAISMNEKAVEDGRHMARAYVQQGSVPTGARLSETGEPDHEESRMLGSSSMLRSLSRPTEAFGARFATLTPAEQTEYQDLLGRLQELNRQLVLFNNLPEYVKMDRGGTESLERDIRIALDNLIKFEEKHGMTRGDTSLSFVHVYQTNPLPGVGDPFWIPVIDSAHLETFFAGESILVLARGLVLKFFSNNRSIPLNIGFSDGSGAVALVTGQEGDDVVFIQINGSQYRILFPKTVIDRAKESLQSKKSDAVRQEIQNSPALAFAVQGIHAIGQSGLFAKERPSQPVQQTNIIVLPPSIPTPVKPLQDSIGAIVGFLTNRGSSITTQYATMRGGQLVDAQSNQPINLEGISGQVRVFGDVKDQTLVGAVKGRAGVVSMPSIEGQGEQIRTGNYLLAFVLADMLSRVDISKLSPDEIQTLLVELAKDARIQQVFSMIYSKGPSQIDTNNVIVPTLRSMLRFEDRPGEVEGLIRYQFPLLTAYIGAFLAGARLVQRTVDISA